jgi:hypothetical protein
MYLGFPTLVKYDALGNMAAGVRSYHAKYAEKEARQ